MTMVMAHAGSWILNLIYIAPVVVVVGALSVSTVRENRRARRSGAALKPKKDAT